MKVFAWSFMTDLQMLARGKMKQRHSSWETSSATKGKPLTYSAFLTIFFFFPAAQWLIYPATGEIKSIVRNSKTTFQQ